MNFVFYLVNYPGCRTKDGPLQTIMPIAVLVVVDIQVCDKLFRLGKIYIDFFFRKVVNVFIVYFYLEKVLGRGLVIDTDLLKGIQANQSQYKRERKVFRALPLHTSDNLLANAELREFSVCVVCHRHTGGYILAQEGEIGAPKCNKNIIQMLKIRVRHLLSGSIHFVCYF